jgi:ribosomal protein S17E
MGSIRQSLQAQPKNIKKLSKHQIKKYQNTISTNHDESFSRKSMLSTLKKKRSQKFVWGLPDRMCRLNPKS